MKIYQNSDVDVNLLKNKKIGIIGYGNQGRAQALNLLDNDLNVQIGLRRKSDSIDTVINEQPLIFESDPYENLGAHFSNSSTIEGKLQISLKSYFQSVLMVDSLKNVGMKFYSSINNSLFDTVDFDLDNDLNRVEIFYDAP